MVELIWDNKQEMLSEINSETFYQTDKKLIPCIEESKNFDNTENLYIEGDNLDALKLLKKDYENKIKMIYIDPPYNTEKKFIYNDTFRNKKKKECRHSDWLNMIYPRLKLARDLLTDDGAIFISIDYNEFSNMKKILDEIFGEENFQREIIWRIGWLSGYKTTAPNFIRNHDTILFYSKNSLQLSFIKKYILNSEFKPLIKKDSAITGKLDLLGLSKKQQNELLQFINYDNRPDKYPIEDTWNCNEYDDLNSIAIVSFSGEKISKILDIPQDFKGQKSIKMLQRLLVSMTNDDDTILDFFSGTASTAHAVMQLNAEDGGNRKFIMVQMQEETDEKSEAYKAGYKNICEIGKERIRRAGEKIKADKPNVVFDDGFKVYKIN